MLMLRFGLQRRRVGVGVPPILDAPEMDQPYGVEARDVMVRLIVGHHVDVRPVSGFSYGRMWPTWFVRMVWTQAPTWCA
jgi:hypothetical protein